MPNNPPTAQDWADSAQRDADAKALDEKIKNIVQREIKRAIKPLAERLDAIEASLADLLPDE